MSKIDWGLVGRVSVMLREDPGWKIEEPYQVVGLTRHRNGEVSLRLKGGDSMCYTYSGGSTLNPMPEGLELALHSMFGGAL